MKKAIWKGIICVFIGILLLMPISIANYTREDIKTSTKEESIPNDSLYIFTGENLVSNPSFEEGITKPLYWDHYDYHDGTQFKWGSEYGFGGILSVGIADIGGKNNLYDWSARVIEVDHTKEYGFSFWYKFVDEPADEEINVGFYERDEGGNYLPSLSYGGESFPFEDNEWHYFYKTWSPRNPETKYLEISLGIISWTNSISGMEARFDDVFFGEIGKEPPVTRCKITPPPDGENNWYISNISSIEVKFNAIDTKEEVNATYYRIQNQDWKEYSGGFSIDITEGSQYLEYYSVDTLGNEETIKPLFIKVDTANPIMTLNKPTPGVYLKDRQIIPLNARILIIGNITIDVELIDYDSGAKKVEFYLDNNLMSTDESPPYSYLLNKKITGSHNLKILGYDMAGRVANQERKIWIFNP